MEQGRNRRMPTYPLLVRASTNEYAHAPSLDRTLIPYLDMSCILEAPEGTVRMSTRTYEYGQIPAVSSCTCTRTCDSWDVFYYTMERNTTWW